MDKMRRDVAIDAERTSAFRDLTVRLRDCQGAANLVAAIVGMAADVVSDIAKLLPATYERPATVETFWRAEAEHSAFSVRSQDGQVIAFTETMSAAEQIAEALNIVRTIRENEDAAGQG